MTMPDNRNKDGQWLPNKFHKGFYACSLCGISLFHGYWYCPGCGAKMEKTESFELKEARDIIDFEMVRRLICDALDDVETEGDLLKLALQNAYRIGFEKAQQANCEIN